MAEYIDRIDFINKLEVINGCVDCNEKCRDCGVNDIKGMLRSIPAADVAQVVHGKWLNFYNDFSCAECDRCGTILEVTDNETDEGLWNAFLSAYRYCPNCGAKMDEEVNVT